MQKLITYRIARVNLISNSFNLQMKGIKAPVLRLRLPRAAKLKRKTKTVIQNMNKK